MEFEKIFKAKRISIISPSGSGKSTLAVKLGEILRLPVYHTDALEEQTGKVADRNKWIIDGIRLSTLEKRINRSNIVIYLNFPIDFCIAGVNSRHEQKEKRLGMPKTFSISKEEFRLNCLNSLENWNNGRGEAIKILAQKYAPKFVGFKSREELESWLGKMLRQ